MRTMIEQSPGYSSSFGTSGKSARGSVWESAKHSEKRERCGVYCGRILDEHYVMAPRRDFSDAEAHENVGRSLVSGNYGRWV